MACLRQKFSGFIMSKHGAGLGKMSIAVDWWTVKPFWGDQPE